MVEPAYEMLWDCSYCGAKKLLGLTHRHCPNCGAKQDPNARYFPADHEKISVQGHQYVGADVQCRYCSAACSRRAHHCGQCGAPLAEGAPVQQLAQPAPLPMTFGGRPPSAPPQRAAWKLVVPIAALVVVAVAVLLLVWKKEQTFTVDAHVWQRSVSIERLGPQRQSTWCDQMPAVASDISRHRERRSSKKVPDGEDCRTKKQDRGDGTFVETQDCSPKFKEEPVYDEKCDFSVVKWGLLRKEAAEGKSLADAPRWPAVALGRAGCSQPGCEREGARQEAYTVVFRDQAGERYRCDFPQPVWSRFAAGSAHQGKLRSLINTLDCSTLSPTH